MSWLHMGLQLTRWVPIGKGSVKVMPSPPPNPSSAKRRDIKCATGSRIDIPTPMILGGGESSIQWAKLLKTLPFIPSALLGVPLLGILLDSFVNPIIDRPSAALLLVGAQGPSSEYLMGQKQMARSAWCGPAALAHLPWASLSLAPQLQSTVSPKAKRRMLS